jgi:hypothetical protein
MGLQTHELAPAAGHYIGAALREVRAAGGLDRRDLRLVCLEPGLMRRDLLLAIGSELVQMSAHAAAHGAISGLYLTTG